MKTTLRRLFCVSAAVWLAATTALGQVNVARQDGFWDVSSTWLDDAVPGADSWVYIGSDSDAAARTATVTLRADQSADSVYLGYGAKTNGTLKLGDNDLNLTGFLWIGHGGGSGTVERGSGSLAASALLVDSGNTFAFGTGDVVGSLSLYSNAHAATAAAGNVAGDVLLSGGSSLALGDNMSLAGWFWSDDGSDMTLDMGHKSLTADGLMLGWNNGGALAIENRGAIVANTLWVGKQQFNFHPTDRIEFLALNNAEAKTAATGDVYGRVWLVDRSTLTLGADMTLSSMFNADDATAHTLDMGGFSLTAESVYLGWDNGGSLKIDHRGAIHAHYLRVGDQKFDFSPDDQVWYYYLRHGESTVANVTNITDIVELYDRSKLTLDANLSLAREFTADDGTDMTLDMRGHSLSADYIQLGWDRGGQMKFENRGPLSANYLAVGNQTFEFHKDDSVGSYYSWNATSTNAANGNVRDDIVLLNGSTLALGGDLTLTGWLQADDGTDMTLDMGGHTLAAEGLDFGFAQGGRVSIANRGPLQAGYLVVGSPDFNFIGADSVGYFGLSNGTSNTVAAGNVTGAVDLYGNSRLTLGADLSLAGDLWAQEGSVVDAVRHRISANGIYLGYGPGVVTPGRLVDGGAVYANELRLDNGSTASFRAAGTIQNAISLSNGSTLTVLQSKGDLTGLTLDGTSVDSLAIDGTSKLALDFGDNDKPSWIFRWQDPAGSTWETTLQAMIGDGRLSVTAPYGYRLYDSDGYTYLSSAVPVPATLVGLLQLGGIAAGVGLWRRRRGSLA